MSIRIPYGGTDYYEIGVNVPNPYINLLEARAKMNTMKHVRPRKKKKKRKKETDYDYYDNDTSLINIQQYADFNCVTDNEDNGIPDDVILNANHDSGFVFGIKAELGPNKYIGMRQGVEGNILVIGGNGSGKSFGLAKPTLRAWKAAIVATDIKGELSTYYGQLFEDGIVQRPYVVFDPMDIEGIGYDPFWWLDEDDVKNLIANIWEITLAIIPPPHDESQPFWTETEQGIFAAALHYYYRLGLSFSETITEIMSSTVSRFVSKIIKSDDKVAKMFLGDLLNEKPETLANFDRGLRNKLMLFAADPYIQNAFRGSREGTQCFNWGQLDVCNIFLKIPGHKIEQWGSAVILMLTQLIRYLERRPDMYDPGGEYLLQTLLLLDEIARFGALDMIASGMSTLRSKGVNFCVIIQSIAQLDKFYGEYDRRIIFDNCQYLAVLRANDAETQQSLSNLFGTVKVAQKSVTENFDGFMETVSYSKTITEGREPRIFPHEFATLKDVLLLTPCGFYRVDKIQHIKTAVEPVKTPVLPPVIVKHNPHMNLAETEILPVAKRSFVVEKNPQKPLSMPIFRKCY